MVKHILANGCSFTSGGLRNTGDRLDIAWPQVLADSLDCKVTNLATSGAGNTRIYDLTIKEISENPGKYDLVVIMWTEATRVDIPALTIDGTNGKGNGYISCCPFRTGFEGENFSFETNKLQYINSIKQPDDWVYQMNSFAEFVAYMNLLMDRDFRHIGSDKRNTIANKFLITEWTKILGLQSFLESQGIKYIFAQGTPMLASNVLMNMGYMDAQELIGEFIISNPLIDLIDSDKWVNWYPCKSLGGYDYTHKLQDMKLNHSENDSHPNEGGNIMIAEDFENKYKSLYES